MAIGQYNIAEAVSAWMDSSLSLVPTWLVELAEGEIETLAAPASDDEEEDLDELDRVSGDAALPMWGYMWMVKSARDADLVRENPDGVAACGISVYEVRGEIFLGIDGAGYSFVAPHWIPLYLMLGYHWDDRDATRTWIERNRVEIESIPGLLPKLEEHIAA